MEPPYSCNISQNALTNITCKAVATVIKWKVNGTYADEFKTNWFNTSSTVFLNESEHLSMSTVTILGTPESNKTALTCVAFVVNGKFNRSASVSNKAVIYIQGMSRCLSASYYGFLLLVLPGLLESVGHVCVAHKNVTSVLISWNPPFTLLGVPILGYNVTITNTSSGQSKTFLVEDTTLLYSIDYPDMENNFTLTVVAINEVGPGHSSDYVWFTFHIFSSK